jgi:hypothetical protein
MTDAVLERPEARTNILEAEIIRQPLAQEIEPSPREPLGLAFREFGRKATAGITALGLIGAGAEAPAAYATGEASVPPPVVTVVTHQASSSMDSIINKKVIYGEDEHLSIKHVNPATCRTFKTFKNSMDTTHAAA